MSKHLRIKIILAFAAIYLIWGSTYLAIRLGVETLPPFLMVGTRFLIGGALLYGWVQMRSSARPRPSHWLTAVIIGLLMPAGGTGLVTWAEMTVPSGLTALLVAMTPMWIVLADRLGPGRTRLRWPVVAGLVLGFAGVALLINPTDIGRPSEIDTFGGLLLIIATMSWAVGSVWSRHSPQPQSRALGAGMQMMMGGGVALIISLLSGEVAGFDPRAVLLKSWLALAYLISIGSIGFAAYVWLLSQTTTAKVATYAYVNPIVALVLASSLAGEVLSIWTLVCASIIVLAVVIIISAKGGSAPTVAAESGGRALSFPPPSCHPSADCIEGRRT